MSKSKQRSTSTLPAPPKPRKRPHRFWLLTIAGVLGVMLIAFLLMSGVKGNPDQQLAAFLNQAQAPADVREAYQFAMAHPEILKAVPCYCGCVSHGHKHNYNCFMKADGELDQHGLNCGMCVQTALKAKQLYEKGTSLPEIRKQVDETYQKLPDMKPTPTPLPGKGQAA